MVVNDITFSKYHALGNDYIIINPEDLSRNGLYPEEIKRICHRNFGVGSDGILLGPFDRSEGDFGLRIYNPDGSEAEKSGNGLRIFSRYLWDKGFVQEKPFTILTEGGLVKSQIFENGRIVRVDMGGVRTSRPYSIASSPNQAGYYDITVRRVEDGFVSPYLLDNVEIGDTFQSTSPTGQFYYNPVFHGRELVFLAGGSGITPS